MTVRTPPPTRPPQSMGDRGWWNQLLGSVYHLWQRLNRNEFSVGETTIYTGTGTPEGTQKGSVGDLFLRRDGDEGATQYVKESGDGTKTGWAAVKPLDIKSPTDATNGGADDLTEIEYTGIYSDVRRIVVMLQSVSLSGSDDILVQIGDEEGFETSGYDSGSATGSGADSSSSSGFVIAAGAAGVSLTGTMTIHLFDGDNNKWVSTHSAHREDANDEHAGAGSKTLTQTLDRVRIATSGTDTFDSGQVNIIVE